MFLADGSGFFGGGGKNPIKSIQYGSITFGGAVTTQTATLGTTVDPNNAVVLFLGNNFTGAVTGESAGSGLAYVELTNGTTVTATRGWTDNDAVVQFCVMEFNTGILNQNVQRGTITMAAGDTTKDSGAITAVVLANTWLIMSGWAPTDSNVWAAANHNKMFPYMTMASTTVVRLSRNTSGTFTPKAPYQVVEFKVVG